MLVDADHSRASAYADVRAGLELADVVLCHDSYNPSVRAGIRDALAGRDVYCDLDFVPGCLQSNGLWGGFALIMPSLGRSTRYNYDPRVSAQPTLRLMALLRNPVATYADTWWGRFSSITVGERMPAGPPKRLHDPALYVDRAALVRLAAGHGVDLELSGLRLGATDYLLWLAGRRGTVRMRSTRSTAGLFQASGRKEAR